MKRVLIVGGGITGLSLAYFLLKKGGCSVTLVEGSGRLGGTIRTTRRDGFLLEAGPDSFISDKPAGVQLACELGLESELIDTRPEFRKACVVRSGRLYEIPKGFYLMAPTDTGAFFKSPLLSWKGKIRAMTEPLVKRRLADEDESVGSFIRRRFGSELLERIGQPMVAGVYTGDPETISLRATFPRFLDLETRYGSVVRGLITEKKHRGAKKEAVARGPRYGLFLSFRDGMEVFSEALRRQLPASCVHLAQIESLVPGIKGGWQARLSSGAQLEADAMCLTVPARTASTMLRAVDGQLASRLQEIRYESVATINLAFGPGAFERELDAVGMVVPAIEKKSIVAATFVHLKYPGRVPDKHALVRVYVGGAFGREAFQQDDKSMIQSVLKDLRGIVGLRAEPLFTEIHRHPDTMVQYSIGHLERVDAIERETSKHAGLFLTGSSYRGIGIPDCIAQSKATAERILPS